MFQMAGVFAELERAVIRERVMAGLARARAEGKKLGRRPPINPPSERSSVRCRVATAEFGRLRVNLEWGSGPSSGSRPRW